MNNYECNVCEKEFDTKKKLRDHKVWHREKKFKCKDCKKKFIRQQELVRHLLTHRRNKNSTPRYFKQLKINEIVEKVIEELRPIVEEIVEDFIH